MRFTPPDGFRRLFAVWAAAGTSGEGRSGREMGRDKISAPAKPIAVFFV